MLSGNSAMKDDSTRHENRDIVYDSLGRKHLIKLLCLFRLRRSFKMEPH